MRECDNVTSSTRCHRFASTSGRFASRHCRHAGHAINEHDIKTQSYVLIIRTNLFASATSVVAPSTMGASASGIESSHVCSRHHLTGWFSLLCWTSVILRRFKSILLCNLCLWNTASYSTKWSYLVVWTVSLSCGIANKLNYETLVDHACSLELAMVVPLASLSYCRCHQCHVGWLQT